MEHDYEFFEGMHEDLTAMGVPVEYINKSVAQEEEPIAPRDEVGIQYDRATPQAVDMVRGYLMAKGVPAVDIKVTVVIEFGTGEGW